MVVPGLLGCVFLQVTEAKFQAPTLKKNTASNGSCISDFFLTHFFFLTHWASQEDREETRPDRTDPGVSPAGCAGGLQGQSSGVVPRRGDNSGAELCRFGLGWLGLASTLGLLSVKEC